MNLIKNRFSTDPCINKNLISCLASGIVWGLTTYAIFKHYPAKSASAITAQSTIAPLIEIHIEIHGHRGARARFPENTLPAFEHAIQAGAHVLELDLGVSRDEVLVLAHDAEINPTLCLDKNGNTPQKGIALFSLNFEEIKTFDCGTNKHPKFTNQSQVPSTPMPSLDEFFQWIKKHPHPNAKTIGFNIETKQPNKNVGAKRFAELVVKKIKEHNLIERSVLQSFDHDVLIEARKIEPQLRLSALTHKWNQNTVQIAKDLGVEIASPAITFLNSRTIKELHKHGIKVIPWTANTKKEWAKLIHLSVDGIITDDPEGLIQYLKEKK
jgi:glycerophosphoryl diester phosphodiesterase